MAEIMVRMVVQQILSESLRLQDARGLILKRATSGDTPLYQVPEFKLNICMVCELFVQILATGFGVLAFVWATVVLLGGFATLVPKKDFWVITAIVFIQAARVVGLNESRVAEFFNQVPPAYLVLGREHFTTSGVMLIFSFEGWFLIMMALLATLILTVRLVAGAVCISLSIFRLVALSKNHDNALVLHALILFYALVLFQGGLLIMWLFLRLYRFRLANSVSLQYGLQDNSEMIVMYMDKTLSTAINNGISKTINRNLASFAADLMKSDYTHDHIGALLLITVTSQEGHRTRILSQIQSSPLCVSRLLHMVTSKSGTDQRTKICIAEIVAHLASNLRLADISGATESISSMIDPYFTKISTPATNVNMNPQTTVNIRNDQQGSLQSARATNGAESTTNSQQRTLQSSSNTSGAASIRNDQQGTVRSSNTTNVAESQPLIIHGLSILAKLAVEPDNCKQIYDSKGLFSKIISPVKNKVYEIPGDDGIVITEKALEVLSMFVSGTDETNLNIHQNICSNEIAVNDIHLIFEKRGQKYNKMKVLATKILTELYLDMSTRYTVGPDDIAKFTRSKKNIAKFINVLKKIFFEAANESGLRKAAGKALAVLAIERDNCMTIMDSTETETSVVQLLTDMIPEPNDYQTTIAQLLMQFCSNSNLDAEMEHLKSVKTILNEVLKVISNVEQEATANQAGSPRAVAPLVRGRRKSLAAFLGLGLQICEKLNISAHDFDTALAGIPLSMGEFVHKLNDIIEQCKGHSVDSLEEKGPSVDYLIIIKTVTKLCTWMMEHRPDCITEFQNKNTSTKLQGALEDMRELELGILLNGSAGDMANYETLSAIVGAAREKMDPNVQGTSG